MLAGLILPSDQPRSVPLGLIMAVAFRLPSSSPCDRAAAALAGPGGGVPIAELPPKTVLGDSFKVHEPCLSKPLWMLLM